MSAERDELADLIGGAEIWWRQDGTTAAADAILAAGYRKPARLARDSTTEDYRREGVILRSDNGNVYEFRNHWRQISGANGSDYVDLPASVLYDPEA